MAKKVDPQDAPDPAMPEELQEINYFVIQNAPTTRDATSWHTAQKEYDQSNGSFVGVGHSTWEKIHAITQDIVAVLKARRDLFSSVNDFDETVEKIEKLFRSIVNSNQDGLRLASLEASISLIERISESAHDPDGQELLRDISELLSNSRASARSEMKSTHVVRPAEGGHVKGTFRLSISY